MASQKQIEASRANGALSRGPVTPEGKARSSKNATKHGNFSKLIVIRGESEEGFQDTLQSYIDRLQPQDEVELGLVEEIVACHWRIRRSWVVETQMTDRSIGKQSEPNTLQRLEAGFNDVSDTAKAQSLHRYETRLHLMQRRALQTLQALRHSSLRNEPNNSFVYRRNAEISLANEPADPANEPSQPPIEPGEPQP